MRMKVYLILLVSLVLSAILVSALVSYFVARSQVNIRFVLEPRLDNPDYGYLEIQGKRYYQLYTTAEVKDEHVPLGSHYHRVDLRSSHY